MKIMTVVVTYNASKWVDPCFGSLIRSSLPTTILAIDNNSTDDTLDLIAKRYPQVKIHKTGQNLGFGKANNVGMKIALEENFDYVLLLNQDAWIQDDTIEILINDHKKNSDYGVIVPLQFNGAGKLIDSMFFQYTIANNRKLVTKVFKGITGLYEIHFANAACWLMPRSTLKKIGGFDPIFPHYGEDDDYLNRMKKQNLKVGLNISTKINHDREHRKQNNSMKAVVNESYTRELIELKNPFLKIKTRAQLLKDILMSAIKFLTSGFNRYYVYKIISYCKIFKVYDVILEHRKEEVKTLPHYL